MNKRTKMRQVDKNPESVSIDKAGAEPEYLIIPQTSRTVAFKTLPAICFQWSLKEGPSMSNRTITIVQVIAISLFIFLLSIPVPNMAQPIAQVRNGVIHFDDGEVRSVAISGGERPYLLAALSFEGAVSLSGDGKVLDSIDSDDPLSELIGITVSGEYQHENRKLLLVAIVDLARFRILLRGLDPDNGRFVNTDLMAEGGMVPVPPRTTHVCFARDRHDDSLYLFAGGDHGRLMQFQIYTSASGLITTRELQQILIGGATSACSSDDQGGLVYVTEPAMGLWQVIADPEEVPYREPVSLNKPYGQLDEPVAVASVYQDQQRLSLLADTGSEQFLRVSVDGEIAVRQDFAEAFAKTIVDGSIVGIATGSLWRDGRMQDVIAVAVNGDAGDGDIHLLGLNSGSAQAGTEQQEIQRAVVQTLAVSAPVTAGMDAADDPAIWINPSNPADSLMLGADKGRGLGVYDLNGKLIQFLADGRINNIDVRTGFDQRPALAHIAVGSDRTKTALAIYAIDEATRQVSRVDARTIPAEFHDLYGLCMYRSALTGELYAFATSADGLMHQWRLFVTSGNKVDAELVRRINIGTVAEGCVVDDDSGYLYVSEERVAVWRYGAEPDAGEQRTAVARIEAGGVLAEDLEGLAIYKKPDGGGYLVVSSEGSDNYAVYDRQPPHNHRGSFRIRANAEAGLDGTSQTDGIEVTHMALPGYPQGLMVAQDGRYDETQNFKYVSWADIAEQLNLEK